MQIFIDTAILKEIEWAKERGILDGVTTNPTLLNKADRKLSEVVSDILKLVKDKPVSIEAVSQDSEEIINEAKAISKLGKNVYVKVPMTDEGMIAVQELESRGIKTNVTLVFSPVQSLVAAKAGASFISIFMGRLDDIKASGAEAVSQSKDILEKYGYKSKILAASIRNTQHLKEAALAGADIATVPFKVLIQMYRHELTDKGIKKFLEDWENVPK